MKCSNCGKENSNGVLFCAECGKALVDEPINLDLRQINTPASARQVHIVKVNTAKKNAEKSVNKEEKTLKDEPVSSQQESEAQVKENESATVVAEPEKEAEKTEKSGDEPVVTAVGQNSDTAQSEAESAGSITANPPEFPDKTYAPMRKRDWLVVIILSSIPFVNIIMLFVWSFGAKVNKSKKSYAQLQLIIVAVIVILTVASVFIFNALGINLSKTIPLVKNI